MIVSPLVSKGNTGSSSSPNKAGQSLMYVSDGRGRQPSEHHFRKAGFWGPNQVVPIPPSMPREAQRTLILEGQVQFPCPVITIWSLLSSQGTSYPGGSEVKTSACSAGDPGSIPGLERSPGEGKGNPLQYSCLENPMEGEAW